LRLTAKPFGSLLAQMCLFLVCLRQTTEKDAQYYSAKTQAFCCGVIIQECHKKLYKLLYNLKIKSNYSVVLMIFVVLHKNREGVSVLIAVDKNIFCALCNILNSYR